MTPEPNQHYTAMPRETERKEEAMTAPADWHDEEWAKNARQADLGTGIQLLDAARILLNHPVMLSDPLVSELTLFTEAVQAAHPQHLTHGDEGNRP